MGIIGTAFVAFIASQVAKGRLRTLPGAIIASLGLFVLGLLSSDMLLPLLVACLVAAGLLWGSFIVLQRASGIYLPLAVILVLVATWLPLLLEDWLAHLMMPGEGAG
jgi:hypothetical protein